MYQLLGPTLLMIQLFGWESNKTYIIDISATDYTLQTNRPRSLVVALVSCVRQAQTPVGGCAQRAEYSDDVMFDIEHLFAVRTGVEMHRYLSFFSCLLLPFK